MYKNKSLHCITIDGVTINTNLTYNLNTHKMTVSNEFRYRKDYSYSYPKNRFL